MSAKRFAIPAALIGALAVLLLFPDPQENFALYTIVMALMGAALYFVVRWALAQ